MENFIFVHGKGVFRNLSKIYGAGLLLKQKTAIVIILTSTIFSKYTS